MKAGVPVSGALFHFKFLSSLSQKVEEEMVRRQHYGGSREYKRYEENIRKILYFRKISVEYENPKQLIGLGLINEGEWI